MDLGEYQDLASTTDLQKGNQLYHLLGLLSEVGEALDFITAESAELESFLSQAKIVCEKAAGYKRLIRDQGETEKFFLVATDESIYSEIGDLCWYIAALANDYNADLDSIAEQNIKKLEDRKARGVLKGKGDKR
jgi:NTP pyrophosphatase (non-canonical NTP hydrolase)